MVRVGASNVPNFEDKRGNTVPVSVRRGFPVDDQRLRSASAEITDDLRAINFAGDAFGIDNAWQPMWRGGSSYTWLETAKRLRVRSGGNGADSSSGSGARRIRVTGLDANYREISEEISLVGGSQSALTTESFLRVNLVLVTSCGSLGGVNQGDINVETSDGELLSVVPANYSRSLQAIYTVPADFEGFFMGTRIHVVAGKEDADFRLAMRANDPEHTAGEHEPLYVLGSLYGMSAGESDDFYGGDSIQSLPERSDVAIYIEASKANKTDVSCVGSIRLRRMDR